MFVYVYIKSYLKTVGIDMKAKQFAQENNWRTIMSDLNDLKLYGRIVKDAVIKQKDEQQIAFFTIAVNETKKDSNGNYYSEANFFPISTFVKSEKFASYLKRGQPLIIEGRLKQITKEVGTDSSGKRLYDSRIYISVKKIQIIFTGKKEDSFQQNEPNIPEDFVVDTDIPSDDLLISEDIPEMF